MAALTYLPGPPAGGLALGDKTERFREVFNPKTEARFFYKSIGTGIGTQPEHEPLDTTLPRSSYTLELKVTTDRSEAEALIDALNGRGIDAYFTPLSRQGRIVYRVRRGIFPSRKEATKAALALKTKERLVSKIVKLQ